MYNTKKENIAIVGSGRVAIRFANAIHKMNNATLFGVCGRTKESVAEFVRKTENQPVSLQTTDFDTIIKNKEVDIIIIATPDYMHTDMVIAAMKENKHILLEKPLCNTIEDAKLILDAHKNSSSQVALGYHLRWHAGLRLLKDKLQQLDREDIIDISLTWAHTFIEEAKWRKDRDRPTWWCMSGLGTHCIDILRWYFVPLCGEISRVTVKTDNSRFHTNDESNDISITFQNGTTASIKCSMLFDEKFTLKIQTKQGLIVADDMMGTAENRKILWYDEELSFESHNNLYQDEINNLITAINENKPVEVDIVEGYNNVCIMNGLLNNSK